MIAVSGCPRSGTSLMMDSMRITFGDDRILGYKFPQEIELDRSEWKAGRKSLREWAKAQRTAPKRDFKEMNPNGFWECEYSVRGIQFDPRRDEDPAADKIVKIVSQGLAQSDPKYIDKVIFMLRHPRAVAKSQEKLMRPGFNDQGDPEKDGKAQRVHDAQMFNRVTPAAAWWLLKFKIPYLIVEFDDLIENPQAQLSRVQDFLGEGDFNEAQAAVNPALRRSVPQDREGREWDIADRLYEFMRADDLAGIEPFMEEERKKPRNIKQVQCVRLQRLTTIEECKLCREEPNTKRNFMLGAAKRGVCWEDVPCAYDCIVDDMTVEESLVNPLWNDILTDDEKVGIGIDPPCPDRGKTTKTAPCCGGRSRAIEYECKNVQVQDLVGAQLCSKSRCRFYR